MPMPTIETRITLAGTAITLRVLDDEWAPWTHAVESSIVDGSAASIRRFSDGALARAYYLSLGAPARAIEESVSDWLNKTKELAQFFDEKDKASRQ